MLKTYLSNTLFIALIALNCFAQEADSTKQLNEVVVRGFETERKLSETAASVNVLTIKDIQRFENTSLVPVFNTLPGYGWKNAHLGVIVWPFVEVRCVRLLGFGM